ncbi:CYFA0S14e01904g1_1 [Cyberlindnera fabianii]|uniref:CYFA0S14e01904g1_1 n=1 Tax=Cyberlindnera fabianii TaxID=36022 RepID=A0A061B4A8_CYBFA|nr:pH-regulated antigen PRA1 [Cyberlindnera fabianii]CDR44326.1 CYFA0S14e01904g1_1 [Cyberlindnera fabianii]
MQSSILTLLLAAIPAVLAQDEVTSTVWVDAATSTGEVYDWSANWNPDIQIHSSCNRTQYTQIYKGWKESQQLAAQARDHTSRYGNSSDIYRKYFGDAPTAEVIGWYDNIVNQDKTGVLFRCDNPDKNCDNEGWAGHWRGENGTDETVICDLSYTSRRYLSQMCAYGYEVSKFSNALFWASDILHRVWHTEILGQLTVDHYADTYDECLELAQSSPEEAVRNSATLRYYALEVYAYDVALPGVGCSGDDDWEEHAHDHDHSGESSASAEATASEKSESATTTVTGTECHTHANGDVHCS